MMTIFSLTPAHITALLLIFVRIGGVCITAPVLSSPRVPAAIRAGLSIMLAFLLQPVIAPHGIAPGDGILAFILQLAKEAMVGLILGYVATLLFTIVQMAGELQDTQTGFGFAGVVDPNVSQHGAILGQFHMVLMWLIFLIANGHHVLLRAMADSFIAVPLESFQVDGGITAYMFRLVTHMMWIALRLGAPVVGSVLLADLAMGLIQRTAPQMNIMAVGFQTKIATALGITLLALPFILSALRDLVPYMERMLYELMGVG